MVQQDPDRWGEHLKKIKKKEHWKEVDPDPNVSRIEIYAQIKEAPSTSPLLKNQNNF